MTDTADLVFDGIHAFTTILRAALAGDEKSQKRLKDVLPHESYVAVIKAAQDKLDRKKFGSRPGEST